MIHYLVGIGFYGYAAVSSDAAVASMKASRLWRTASAKEFHDAQARVAGDVFFLIHPGGRHVATADRAWADALLGQGFYEVNIDDYQAFVLRHRAVDRSRVAQADEEGDDVLAKG